MDKNKMILKKIMMGLILIIILVIGFIVFPWNI